MRLVRHRGRHLRCAGQLVFLDINGQWGTASSVGERRLTFQLAHEFSSGPFLYDLRQFQVRMKQRRANVPILYSQDRMSRARLPGLPHILLRTVLTRLFAVSSGL